MGFSNDHHDRMSDKRREHRVVTAQKFSIEIEKGKIFKKKVFAEARDLSTHGLRFVCEEKLNKGGRITLTLLFPNEFPGRRELILQGVVIRVYRPKGTKRFRVGCEILHPNPASKETIRQFLDWNLLAQRVAGGLKKRSQGVPPSAA